MQHLPSGDDRICIRGIEVDCLIGIDPVERRELQRVVLDLDLYCDLSRAGETDDIADTLDYKVLRDRVVDCLKRSCDGLIERLAHRVASECLDFEVVSAVTLRLSKPGALTGSRDVAVVLTRRRSVPDAGPPGEGAP